MNGRETSEGILRTPIRTTVYRGLIELKHVGYIIEGVYNAVLYKQVQQTEVGQNASEGGDGEMVMSVVRRMIHPVEVDLFVTLEDLHGSDYGFDVVVNRQWRRVNTFTSNPASSAGHSICNLLKKRTQQAMLRVHTCSISEGFWTH